MLLVQPSFSQRIKEDVVISTNASSVKEIYKPFVTRNPMVASQIMGPTTLKYDLKFSSYTVNISTSILDLDRFSLSGIIKSSDFREALLKDNFSGSIFILRNGKVYDIKKNIIKDIRGEIRGKAILLYNTKNGQKKELIMDIKENEKLKEKL
ncbi:MAG: hypothetical protein K6357_06695 [Elusimicrobiota bacterium]